MVPFFGGCDALKGVLWAIKNNTFFDTFMMVYRAPNIDLFDQESGIGGILLCSKCALSDY